MVIPIWFKNWIEKFLSLTVKMENVKYRNETKKQTTKFINKGTINVFQVMDEHGKPLMEVIDGQFKDVKKAALRRNWKPGVAITREDLIHPERFILAAGALEHDLVERFRGYIREEDLSALRLAIAVVVAEDSRDLDRAYKLREDLFRKYDGPGRQIYNLYRSQFLQTYFTSVLTKMRMEQSDENARKNFSELFSDEIRYFRHGIFIDEASEAEHVVDEFRKRHSDPRSSIIVVFARGEDRIEKLLVLANTAEKDYHYRVDKSYYEIAGVSSAMAVLYPPDV